MRPKGVLSLIATVVLCLPSLIAGIALLAGVLLQRHPAEWGESSAAVVALGVFIGRPLLAIATMIGLVVALRSSVSAPMKSAHLIVVALGMVATIALWYRFRS